MTTRPAPRGSALTGRRMHRLPPADPPAYASGGWADAFSHAEHELRKIVRADRDTIDPEPGVFGNPVGRRRDLGHPRRRHGLGDAVLGERVAEHVDRQLVNLAVLDPLADDLAGALVDGDITVQTHRVLDNLTAVLAAAGISQASAQQMIAPASAANSSRSAATWSCSS